MNDHFQYISCLTNNDCNNTTFIYFKMNNDWKKTVQNRRTNNWTNKTNMKNRSAVNCIIYWFRYSRIPQRNSCNTSNLFLWWIHYLCFSNCIEKNCEHEHELFGGIHCWHVYLFGRYRRHSLSVEQYFMLVTT